MQEAAQFCAFFPSRPSLFCQPLLEIVLFHIRFIALRNHAAFLRLEDLRYLHTVLFLFFLSIIFVSLLICGCRIRIHI
jgi:hypothetical protein